MALLSRVADALFWMGRYIERAENTARMLDVTYHGRLEPHLSDLAGAVNTWEALVTTLGQDEIYVASSRKRMTETDVIEFLTVDRLNPSSISSSLASARENARSVRDFLSSETWVAINRLYHGTAQRSLDGILSDGLYDFCDSIRQGTQLFHGTAENTSLHDEGWYWLRVGVLLERADMITRIVDSKYHLLMTSLDEVGGALDRHQWTAVLRSVSGYEAFRRTYADSVDASQVVDFLLLDEHFPRSLAACVDALQDALNHATEGADPHLRNPAMRDVTQLRSRLQFETAETLVGTGLHEFLESTQETIGVMNAAVSEAFFWSARHAA